MTDYYIGLAVGALIGYGLSLVTMLMIWALCVIAKKEDEREEHNC